MKMSESITEFAKAMAIFQGEVENAKKTADNPFFKSKYADLAEIWDTIRQPLTKNGLAITQIPSADGPKVKITTLVTHLSGQWIEGELDLTATKADPQAIGSAITYGRRYALAAFCGIAQEDDDGNKASQPGKPIEQSNTPEPVNPNIAGIKQSLKDYLNSGTLSPAGCNQVKNAIETVNELPLLEKILQKARTAHDAYMAEAARNEETK